MFITITIIHFTDDSLEDQGLLYTSTMNSAVGLKILASISLAIAPKTTICIKLLCIDCSKLTGLQRNVLRYDDHIRHQLVYSHDHSRIAMEDILGKVVSFFSKTQNNQYEGLDKNIYDYIRVSAHTSTQTCTHATHDSTCTDICVHTYTQCVSYIRTTYTHMYTYHIRRHTHTHTHTHTILQQILTILYSTIPCQTTQGTHP